MVGRDGDSVRYAVNDVQLLDRDLVYLVEDVDTRNVDPKRESPIIIKDSRTPFQQRDSFLGPKCSLYTF